MRNRLRGVSGRLAGMLLVGTLFLGVAGAAVYAVYARDAEEIAQLQLEGPVGEMIRKLVLDAIPHEYEDTRKWGGTKKVWDGLKIETDGLRIKTKRRWKEVRHGTWKRYKMWLVNPDEEFHIHLENVRQAPERKIAFDLVVEAHVGVFGRLSEFRRDIQLISLSVDAESVVRMRLACELAAEFGFDSRLSPQVTLQPEITQADLRLVEFELHRISQIHGDIAEEFGDSLHKVLQREIDQRRGKIVDKANRAIEKNQDELTFSIQDIAASGWEKLMGRMRELGG